MISSLNPKLSAYIAAGSILVILYIILYDINAIVGFVAGILLAYPIVREVWKAIAKNWKNVFKPFYSRIFYKRKIKIIKKSWAITWWIAPYCVISYGALTAALLMVFGSVYVLYGLMLGSVFEIFWFLHCTTGKYYRQIRR